MESARQTVLYDHVASVECQACVIALLPNIALQTDCLTATAKLEVRQPGGGFRI